MATTGFELPHRNAGKTAIPDQTGTKCGALGAHSVPIDTDLQAVIEAWPDLPKSTKADMIAMVRAVEGKDLVRTAECSTRPLPTASNLAVAKASRTFQRLQLFEGLT